eukprot:954408-Prorocentrum_minimum.AAC.2
MMRPMARYATTARAELSPSLSGSTAAGPPPPPPPDIRGSAGPRGRGAGAKRPACGRCTASKKRFVSCLFSSGAHHDAGEGLALAGGAVPPAPPGGVHLHRKRPLEGEVRAAEGGKRNMLDQSDEGRGYKPTGRTNREARRGEARRARVGL